jgi:hypothetical protein
MTPEELATLEAAVAEAAPAALRSLYGYGDRPQEIFTPLSLLAPLLSVWGSIELDPCGHPDSPVSRIAREVWTATDVRKTGAKRPVWDGNGLICTWRDKTYANPPFAELERWLAKACEEADGNTNIAVLAPVRPHRRWWRACRAHLLPIYLNPVCFEGYEQAFPAPLCLFVAGRCQTAVALSYERAGLGEP